MRILSSKHTAILLIEKMLEQFEDGLEREKGDLMKASVKLVREWRTDKVLRRLEEIGRAHV